MGRPINSNVPESGFISKQQFLNTGSVAQSDFAVVADYDNTRKIVFDASGQTSGKKVTITAGANSADVVFTLPTTSGTLSTTTSSFANPMTTGGDIIYGGASGVATRLANGTNGQVLTSSGTTTAPTWTTISSGASTTLNNLGTTSINANLIFGIVGTSKVQTTDVDSTSSGLLIVQSGNTTTAGASGNVTLKSGTTDASNTGTVSVSSGNTNSGASSGAISISTGTGPAATGSISVTTSNAGTNSGGITLQSGNAPSGTSGSLTLQIGTGSTRGQILLVDGTEGTAGYVWTSTDTTGKGSWKAANTGTYVSTQFDTTSSTLANVTGLTATVVAGGVYRFSSIIFNDANVTGGQKYAIGGTATATSIIYQIEAVSNASNLNIITSRQTALAGSAGQAGSTGTYCQITGTIVVNAGGTLTVQFAQNTATGTSSVLVGSTFQVSRIS